MKILKLALALSAILIAAACDKGETGDPATEDRSDLNPPSGLVSITGDGQITLRWRGNNTEDDFKGYDVFMYAGDITEGTDLYSFPSADADLAQASLPRCADNSSLFVAFGFDPTDRECGGTSSDDDSSSDDADALMLVTQDDDDDDADDDDDTADEALASIVKCETGSTENISLEVAEGDGLGPQTCVIKTLPDGTTAVANGTTYSFFVTSVMGDDYETISWTSNFVVDTPAKAVFSGNLTFESGKGLFLPIAKLQEAVASTSLTSIDAIDADDFESAACPSNSYCTIGSSNGSSNDAGLYFGRLGGSKPLRIFFSTPEASGDAIKYAYRGAQTFDPGGDSDFSTTIPGDQAAEDTDSSSPYLANGSLTPIYQNQVFDIAVWDDSASTLNYGKVVFGARTVEDSDDTDSDVTIPVTILMQEATGVRHYLK